MVLTRAHHEIGTPHVNMNIWMLLLEIAAHCSMLTRNCVVTKSFGLLPQLRIATSCSTLKRISGVTDSLCLPPSLEIAAPCSMPVTSCSMIKNLFSVPQSQRNTTTLWSWKGACRAKSSVMRGAIKSSRFECITKKGPDISSQIFKGNWILDSHWMQFVFRGVAYCKEKKSPLGCCGRSAAWMRV